MNKKDRENCVAFIFARGGSKGIPGKNKYKLNGKPLISYSIEIALQCQSICDVIVSTDDKEIAQISKKLGANVPFMRPTELAKDDSNEFDSWKHAINEYEKIYKKKIDIFISLPATSPLRVVSDVENCIKKYREDSADMIITVKNASANPYCSMVKNDSMGFSHIVNSKNNDRGYFRRQDAPKVYDMTGVAYISSTKYILNSNSIFSGKVKSVKIPDERALDIDNILDLEFAEFLIQNRKNKLG